MGDIADMMINGDMDFYTGEYLGKGAGYPRTADKSLPWEKTTHNNLGGVLNYIIKHTRCDRSTANKIIKRYGRDVLNIIVPKLAGNEYKIKSFPILQEIANKIQGDWSAFCLWFKKNYPIL